MKQRPGWNYWYVSDLIKKGSLDIGDGYRAKNSEMCDEGLPFARAGNVNNGFHFDDADILSKESVNKAKSAGKLSKPGDVTFTSKGTFGRFAYVSRRTRQFVYSPQLCYWRVKDHRLIDHRFLYYWIQGPDSMNQLVQIKGLTDMADYVSLTNQRRMWLSAPPLPIQHKIAAVLSTYDDLIENNLQRIKILEEMAQNLYREWFVKFRFPGHQHARFVDSSLGKIPEGWEAVPFTQIADVLSGGTPKTTVSDYWDGQIPFFAPKDTPSSFFVTETEKQITEIGLRKCNSKLYPPQTVFITARGTVGKVVMPAVPMAMNQSCYALRGKSGISQPFLFMMTLEQVAYLKKNTGGATFDTIVVDTFHRMQVIRPDEKVVETFTQRIEPTLEMILNLTKKNTTLRRTRDLLLPKLISGEVDVSELDIAVPEEDNKA